MSNLTLTAIAPIPCLRVSGDNPKLSPLTHMECDRNIKALTDYAADIASAFLVEHTADGALIDRSVGNDKLKPGPIIYAQDSGACNALEIAPDPVVSGYSNGDAYLIVPSNSNTGAATLCVNGLNSNVGVPIYKNGSDSVSGDIVSGQLILVVYSDGKFHLLTRSESAGITNATSAISSDLTLTNANQYYSAITLSLDAGTYLVTAQITFKAGNTATNAMFYGRISNGTTHWSSGIATRPGASPFQATISLSAVVTLSETNNVMAQAASSVTSAAACAALVTNGSGNTATQMTAIKLS